MLEELVLLNQVNIVQSICLEYVLWIILLLPCDCSVGKGCKDQQVKFKERCFLSCHECGTRKKILSPHEESHLRPSDSMLRFSTTEPQRLHSERGLLRSSYDTHPAYC